MHFIDTGRFNHNFRMNHLKGLKCSTGILKRAKGNCVLSSSSELLASSTDDILITPKEAIYTDLLVIRGNFTKITLCIYGNIIDDDTILNEKCRYYNLDVPIEPLTLQGSSQMYKLSDSQLQKYFQIKKLIS
eukprot:GHVR01062130.1.p1 GENE.GHVR01062130.1~~GHVR01062130.1.p1  ORF type:complete len:132 (+),score=2.87 GHVR01062130.1:358-753(+)